jgi:hypothetical protein
MSSAYEHPSVSLVAHWRDTADAAVRASRAADPDSYISTPGHVLAVPDFIATLVTEAAVHHLDLVYKLPEARQPDAKALATVRATLDGLLGPGQALTAWDDATYALKGTGRLGLTGDERSALGALADRFPLLG